MAKFDVYTESELLEVKVPIGFSRCGGLLAAQRRTLDGNSLCNYHDNHNATGAEHGHAHNPPSDIFLSLSQRKLL